MEKVLVIDCGTAHDFYKTHRALTRPEVAQKLVIEHLQIVPIDKQSEEQQKNFTALCTLVSGRLNRLIAKLGKNRGWRSGLHKTDVFLDLQTDYPDLVDTAESDSEPLFSQISSASSTKSWLENEIPAGSSAATEAATKRREFSSYCQKTKRRKTDDLRQTIKEFAEENGCSVLEILMHLAYSETYQTNKSLASIFRKIEQGELVTETSQVPVDVCLHVKEECMLGRRRYTNLRHILSPWVSLTPYHKVSAEAQSILPEPVPLQHGLAYKARFNLSENAYNFQ